MLNILVKEYISKESVTYVQQTNTEKVSYYKTLFDFKRAKQLYFYSSRRKFS